MKRVAPVLLALSACVMLFPQDKTKPASLGQSIQQLPTVNAIPRSVRTEIVQAQAQVLRQQDIVLKARELSKTDPAAVKQVQDAQKKLEEDQKVADETKKTASTPNVPKYVNDQQRKHLTDLVSDFHQEVDQTATSASSWEITLIAGGVLLGLASAILSIFSLNKAAAVASALVVVAGGVPRVYPIHERAVYYRTLTNQSYSLLGNLQIPFQMTSTEYDDGATRLKVLEEYRATKYPQSADMNATTQELFKDLNAAKTTTAETH